MAAIGGILAASRLLAVNQSSGGSDLLLLAIAGPVIAGTSLFGGRGSVWSALLGALVIGSISNGMDLLALDSSVKFMVTGAVLLAAVIVDAAGATLEAGRRQGLDEGLRRRLDAQALEAAALCRGAAAQRVVVEVLRWSRRTRPRPPRTSSSPRRARWSGTRGGGRPGRAS